ncbi:c-type cytochrome [Rhodosalinus sp.]|uniref:c-type cytochrome n=1 Tax=Rhodosalinus sp. TaxID=2047741 RepID=UPI0035637309
MHLKARIFAAATAFSLVAPAAMAQDDFEAQLKARQGQFRIMALNLGVLGGMAQGEIEYDAERAQTAADTLVTVTGIDQSLHWPEGSDAMSMDGTRAEPSIWDDNEDFLSKWEDLGDAAAEMQAAAGDGRQAVGAALQNVGGTCKACHDAHRTPES